MIEHAYVQMKIVAAVGGEHALAEEIVVFGLAVSGESHHLPLVAGEHVEADEVRDRRIKLAERMRQLDAFEDAQLVALPLREERGRVFARAVPGDNGGAFEAGGEEGARRVTLVMFEKMEAKLARPEMFADTARVLEHAEIAVAHLRDAAINPRLEHVARNQRSLQSLHRLVAQNPGLPVVADVFDIGDFDVRVIEAELDGVVGEAAVVL